MEKSGAMSIMYMLLPVLLLVLTLSSEVGAVDIIILEKGECVGRGLLFADFPPQTCAVAKGHSVLVLNAFDCHLSGTFVGGKCKNQTVGAFGNVCYTNGTASGAAWEDRCVPRRQLLGKGEHHGSKIHHAKDCDSKPTGVVFTEDFTKGSWILRAPNATQIFSHLGNVTFGERANWLKGKGAHFMPPTSKVSTLGM